MGPYGNLLAGRKDLENRGVFRAGLITISYIEEHTNSVKVVLYLKNCHGVDHIT